MSAASCDDGDGDVTATATPLATATPTLPASSPTPQPPVDLASLIGPRAELPQMDPIDLAARYGQTTGRAPRSKPFAGEANAGDRREFLVAQLPGSQGPPPVIRRVTATLQAKSAHAYFYADDAIGAGPTPYERAAEQFETVVWPAVTTVFGEPPSPGVDGDPRIIVLHAHLGGVGGYVSPDDGYLRAVRPLSNEAEMIYMDASVAVGEATFTVVLAHELQHLSHERSDAGEESWVNEGLSETALGLAGGALSSVDAFAARPSTQLNDWSIGGNLPHYGAGAAFFRYLADRFGGDPALGRMATASGDGPVGVEEFLASTGESATFAAVFRDWIAANALDEASGPYGTPSQSVSVQIEGALAQGATVDADGAQFGTDYYLLEGAGGGEYELRFAGAAATDVLPLSPAVEGAFWWSNAGDQIDTTLTREVDLRGVEAPKLTFRTWYDIEPWYDRGYVSVSADGGSTWRAMSGTTTTEDDPVEMTFGPGYQGMSSDADAASWRDEEIDLSEFAGRLVLLRFEYATDGGTHGQGWAVDGVAVGGTEVDGSDASDAAWQAEGWVRLDRPLEQRWIVTLIAERDGLPVVMDVPLDAGQTGTLRFDATGLTDAVVAVAGATEGTVRGAPYTIQLARP